MDYMSVKEAAEYWSMSECWIQKLCERRQGRRCKTLGPFMDDSKDAKSRMI